MTSVAKSPKQKARSNRSIEIDKADKRKYERIVVDLRDIDGTTNKIVHANAFEALPRLRKESFDMLFADPPYNLSKKFGKEEFKQTNSDDYEEWLDSWLQLCVPSLKNTASVYICGDWRSSAAIQRVGSRHFKLQNRITWEREKGRGAKRNWKNAAEDIWFFSVSNEFTFNLDAVKQRRRVLAPYRENGKPKDWTESKVGNFRNTHPSNIWTDITVPFWSMPENTDHPTQKPEKLMAKVILASTDPGDLILDPFAGSGTTAAVAKKLGRDFLVIESDKDYCLLTAKRLEMADVDKTIQGLSDGVFWERNSQKRSG